MTRVLRPVAVAIVVGAVLSAGVVGLVWHSMSPGGYHTPPPGDRVQHAIDALRTDHVYVGIEARGRLGAADLTSLEEAAKSASVPTYVVYWQTDGSDWGPTIYPVAETQIEEALGDDAVLVTADADTGKVTIDGGRVYGADLDDLPAKSAPGPALLADVKQLAADPSALAVRSDDDSFTASEGLHQGLMIGGGIGLLAALISAIAAAITYSDARSSAKTKSGKTKSGNKNKRSA